MTKRTVTELINVALRNPLAFVLYSLSQKYANKIFNANSKDFDLELYIPIFAFEGLVDFIQSGADLCHNPSTVPVLSLPNFLSDPVFVKYYSSLRSKTLADLFDSYSSDKASSHLYNHIYQPIIDLCLSCSSSLNIGEIGLGSYNLAISGNMGLFAKPGASAFALANYSASINYYGGDIDPRTLFSSERINTMCLDQLNAESLSSFYPSVRFDIFIDDGLHIPAANLSAMMALLPRMNPGSFYIIEDIHPRFAKLWQRLATVFNAKGYSCYLVNTSEHLCFILRSISSLSGA
jgi:hypothetical protein